MKTAIIYVQGGLVQHILTNDSGMRVVVLDFDTDGADEEGVMTMPEGEGLEKLAYVVTSEEEYNPDTVSKILNAINKRWPGAVVKPVISIEKWQNKPTSEILEPDKHRPDCPPLNVELDPLDVAMVAVIMSDEVLKKLYNNGDTSGLSYLDAVEIIGKWAVEFELAYSHISDWAEALEHPEKIGLSSDVMCWDDAVMDFAKRKLTDYCEMKDLPDQIQIVWTVDDFESVARQEEGVDLGQEYTDEKPQLYDRSKFRKALSEMHHKHDPEQGISWDTIRYWLDEKCKII